VSVGSYLFPEDSKKLIAFTFRDTSHSTGS